MGLHRRSLLVGGAIGLLRATARAEAEIRRVALVTLGAPNVGILAPPMVQNFARRGYVEGQNVAFERHAAAANHDSLPGIFDDLLQRRPDVIITQGYPTAAVAKERADSIAVVATLAGDLVDTNLAATIPHPGGNLTGISDFATELSPKRLALLVEAVPGVHSIALLYDAGDLAMTRRYQAVQSAADQLKLTIVPFGVREPNDFGRAFSEITRAPPEAIMMVSDSLTTLNRARVIEYAQEHRIPAMFEFAYVVHDGGLLAYGAHLGALFDRAADLACRILKGAKPSELPIEFPTRIQFAVNLRAARAIGLTIPESVVLRADDVVE